MEIQLTLLHRLLDGQTERNVIEADAEAVDGDVYRFRLEQEDCVEVDCLTVGEREIVLERVGAICTTMCFRPDEWMPLIYKTSYGSHPMKLFTHKTSVQKKESRIEIRLEYTISV